MENRNALIVAPSFSGANAQPSSLSTRSFPKLLQLTGDRIDRRLIEKYHNRTALVEWNDEVSFEYIDDRDDHEKIKAVDLARTPTFPPRIITNGRDPSIAFGKSIIVERLTTPVQPATKKRE